MEEIIAVMRPAGEVRHARRIRGLIVVLWRAGLRISEALMLTETDLDPAAGSVLVRSGKGGRRRVVGLDVWAWAHLDAWVKVRVSLPVRGIDTSEIIDTVHAGRPPVIRVSAGLTLQP